MNEVMPVDKGVVRRALGLKKEGIFKLLLVLTALLGWVSALGGGGAVLLQQAWNDWSLNRAQLVTVYLPAASAPVAVNTLAATLATEPGISKVDRVPESTLHDLLAPYGVGAVTSNTLPLPIVLEVQTDPQFDRTVLAQRVQQSFSTAEIDDARASLQQVARAVRLAQIAAALLALVMLVVMLGLVGMTVRVGLRSQKATLILLRQLGAADRQLVALVAGQVAGRVLPGWLFAAGAGEVSLELALRFFADLQPLTGISTWLAILLVPLALPVGAIVFSMLIAQRQLNKMA